MHQWLVSAALYMIFCFLFTSLAYANPNHFTDELFISCGSTGASVGPDGRRWLGDKNPNFTIRGSSTKSWTVAEELAVSDDPAPYKTARVSRSQFSYVFRLDSGQKLIRLHFNPATYNGFRKSRDFFSVEAGPFTLLSNFSASITAEDLAVKFFTKEFCVVTEKNHAFSVTFSPTTVSGQSYGTHAFINAIEVISVPETLSYCHTGGRGVQVVGEKFLVYVDNSTALEMVHRQNVKRGSVALRDDFRGMFGSWAGVLSKEGMDKKNITWRVSVNVGFRYLVRLHFCELGLKMAENGNTSFIIVINHMVVCTNTDVVGKMGDTPGLFYRNYMVMAKGRKLEGKRDITISLQSREEFFYGHVPLEGFEIFKLSNHDNSLASPNPLPPAHESPYWIVHDLFSILGHKDAFASVVIIVICFVNIVVHKLRQTWEVNFPEDKKPTTKVSQTCRCFSLREMQAATKNFDEAYVIGRGGFGKVYKGFIDDDPQIVAIKRLKPDSKQGKREFWTEVETLSELRHVNLVSLIGYCNEQQEMILVYEYMPNGTLADHLYKLARKKSNYYILSWEERLQICIGAARGLDYLHTGKGVVHRDVKASNILLDESFVAKVSDFGLAKNEGFSGLQNQDSTNLKGTFGYIDPDYFRSRKLTMKSDTYAFGVVLLEVLCGRPAVDPLAGEDERSLTIWARDNFTRGKVDEILAPSLSGDILPYSLQAFLGVVERCLHDDPNKRPPIARVIINLEIALEQQKAKSLSLVPNAIASLADFFPFTDRNQQEYSKLLVTGEMTKVADILQSGDKIQQENATSLMPYERVGVADVWQRDERMSMSTMQQTMPFSPPQDMMSASEQSNSKILNTGLTNRKKDGRNSIMRKLSRLLPWDSGKKTAKPSTRTEFAGISLSAPLSKHTSNQTRPRFNSIYQNTRLPTEDGNDDLNSSHNLRVFSFLELKAATRNFKNDTVLGEGGFGRVYKGFLKEKSANNNATGSIVAIKRLNSQGFQGLQEWLSEISFLGKIHHPNLVKLLGYCVEKEELLIVYEYMPNGSLENHLFRRNPARQTLQWDIRLKILIGAARGLTYLHNLVPSVIYRDVKMSNILLGESYDAKLSDFGLAKSGPSGDDSHVTTRVVGTYGYASPEYIATGHLTVKSDVYGFGVVLLEIVTGLRVVDNNRPSGQQSLVNWIKPCFKSRKKLMGFIDLRLEGSYSPKSALQVFQLAKNCLEANPKVRPSMQEVVEVLEAVAVEKLPREPRVRFNSPVASPAR